MLDGKDPTIEHAVPWGGSAGEPAGYRLEYRWGAGLATGVDQEWPLLRSDAATPEPPYDSTQYRIRATDVTGLQVDVLLDGARVIQVMPKDGETEYVLVEQTWPPFSWIPWFTANPWVVAPIFIALVLVFMVRAWLRSRAWNRRLPSMTRHDRQFIARVVVLVFLLAGFAWQFYEGWYAATGPSVDSGASAGSLASLPLLLIPPGLFVAGLILELSSAPRRGSWALLAVLSVAASAYFLASAMTGATTNLNLTYYLLLAVLALIAIPRARSPPARWGGAGTPRRGTAESPRLRHRGHGPSMSAGAGTAARRTISPPDRLRWNRRRSRRRRPVPRRCRRRARRPGPASRRRPRLARCACRRASRVPFLVPVTGAAGSSVAPARTASRLSCCPPSSPGGLGEETCAAHPPASVGSLSLDGRPVMPDSGSSRGG